MAATTTTAAANSKRKINRSSSFHLENYEKVERVYQLVALNNLPSSTSTSTNNNVDNNKIKQIDQKKFNKIFKDANSNNCINTYKKRKIRNGIPKSYRPYVWLLAAGISMEEDIDSIIDHHLSRYNASLRNIFGTCNFNEINIPDDSIPSFAGNSKDKSTSNTNYLHFHYLTKNGIKAAKRLLCVISQMYPVNSCTMLPNIICMLLSSLPEVLIPSVVGEMMKRSDYFFFIGYKERQQAVTNTYIELMESKIASKKNINKSLNFFNNTLEIKPETFILFDIMTKYFFLNIISYEYVLQIFDVYMFEGRKILFRFTISLIHEFYSNQSLNHDNNILSNYQLLRKVGNSFDKSKMKQIFTRAFNYSLRRKDINTKLKLNAKKLDVKIDSNLLNKIERSIINIQNDNVDDGDTNNNNNSNNNTDDIGLDPNLQNGTFFQPRIIVKDDKNVCLLETNISMKLYKYLPKSLKIKDLKLLYRAATEGYNLKNLIIAYRDFKGPTLLCIEPLLATKNNPQEEKSQEIIGIFTPTSWFPDEFIFPTLGSSPADTFVFTVNTNCAIYRINKNNLDDLVNCTITNTKSRKKASSAKNDHLIFGIDTKESLKMGLRVDGDLKFGQSTANNIFVNMNKSLSQIHGEKEFLMKHVELYGFVDRV